MGIYFPIQGNNRLVVWKGVKGCLKMTIAIIRKIIETIKTTITTIQKIVTTKITTAIITRTTNNATNILG
jgi:murein L,D-transpeptidase YafK